MGYRSKVRGYGLAVGIGENLFWGSYSGSFGEMSYWDDIPPKRSNDELESQGACHEG